jgi:hypothetical protein
MCCSLVHDETQPHTPHGDKGALHLAEAKNTADDDRKGVALLASRNLAKMEKPKSVVSGCMPRPATCPT